MSIAKVIAWKFNDQEGMRCKEVEGIMTIVEFPGGIPSQVDQDTWTQEYADWVAAGGEKDIEAVELADPKKAFAALMELLWDNSAELQAAFPNPDGQNKFKQAAVTAYKAKL